MLLAIIIKTQHISQKGFLQQIQKARTTLLNMTSGLMLQLKSLTKSSDSGNYLLDNGSQNMVKVLEVK